MAYADVSLPFTMNLLSVESLSKSFGVKTLFKDLTFGINKGQRVGLIARNGAGKSTLLNILMGKDTPDSGNVSIRKECRINFLDQEPVFNMNNTVFEAIYAAESAALQAIRKYEAALIAYEKDHSSKNEQAFQNASQEMDHLQAWDYEIRIKEILSRLGIDFFERKIALLSGGEKKRLALASLLVQDPELLILDEPTNHLDVEMIEWLEEYLLSRDISLLLVTHDRYFLDSVCTEIIELENGKLYFYKGDFSYYVEKKAEREIAEASELEKNRNIYRRELEWVRRMPKARTTKSKSRIDAFDELEQKVQGVRKQEKLNLSVKTERLGGKILEMMRITKNFDEKKIIDTFSYVFKQKDRIGIVGKNGAGKSTFLNMIMGLEPISSGKIVAGETVVFGYYTQQGLKLPEDKRIIEVVKDIAEFIPLADGTKLSASQLLQRFLFPPDVQYGYVSKLSGGEKRRLHLLTILVKNPNFLILDEPTNDLDLVTLAILEDFLSEFKGCLLIVSHDRYFMDRLVDHLFVFDGTGQLEDFNGRYTDYRNEKEQREIAEKEKAKQAKIEQKAEVKAPVAVSKSKASFKEKQEFEQLAKDIEVLEKEQSQLSEQLASGSEDLQQLQKWSDRFATIKNLLDEKGMRWLELSEIV